MRGGTQGFSKNGKPCHDARAVALTDSIPKIARALAFLNVERPAGTGAGTAFVVGSGGVLATSAHLLRDAVRLEVTLVGSAGPSPCTILETDLQADVALLRMEARDLASVSLRRGPPVSLGREVAFMGFPHADIFQPPLVMTMRGIVGNRYKLGTIEYYVVDAAASEGMSGGPLFLADTGEVIAVVGGRFDPGRTRARLGGAREEALRDRPAERTSIMFAASVEYVLALLARRS
jgi:serine protease Do